LIASGRVPAIMQTGVGEIEFILFTIHYAKLQSISIVGSHLLRDCIQNTEKHNQHLSNKKPSQRLGEEDHLDRDLRVTVDGA
jgi:hypothetical protein